MAAFNWTFDNLTNRIQTVHINREETLSGQIRVVCHREVVSFLPLLYMLMVLLLLIVVFYFTLDDLSAFSS